MAIPFANIIKPKLKPMNAESPFGEFHNILTESLNEWFNLILPLQTGITTGTVITPSGYTYPFIYPLMKSNALKIYFNVLQVKMCALGGGEDFYPKLFNYIGLTITQQLTMWTSSPPSMGIPNPIYLTGIATPPPITTHFYGIGLAYKQLLSVKPPADEDVFDYTWAQFEEKLRFAINTIPMLWMPVMGVTPFGVYTGVGTLKFIV